MAANRMNGGNWPTNDMSPQKKTGARGFSPAPGEVRMKNRAVVMA